MRLITAQDVSKTYANGDLKVEALRQVSFAIEPASLVAFVGPSGSGKSTLLNLLGCLDKPTSGRLQVAGTEVAGLSRRAAAAFRGKQLGFIFQDFNLIPVLTVFENVEYPLIMVQSVPAAERRKRVTQLLEAVGMYEQGGKYPDQISGGQKQRVAVARALITRPALVLADEPTANLDGKTAQRVIHLIREMKQELGTTFVFSTHDPRVVSEVDQTYTLQDGALVDGGEGNADA